MSKLRFVGLDVHAETIAVAVAEPGGEVRSLGVIPNRLESIRKLIRQTRTGPSICEACYEAGPTGYVLYWQLTQLGVACEVIAPSLVPTKAGDRVKTDRRDAEKLARCYRAGELTAVWVPDAAHEALRDLVRAREAAKKDQLKARHRLGQVSAAARPRRPEGMKAWTKKHLEWIKSHVHFEQPALEATLAGLPAMKWTTWPTRIVKLEKAIDEAVRQAPPEIRAVIEALQALRGVAQTTAATIVSELGSLLAFPESTAADGLQRPGGAASIPAAIGCSAAAITKTGNAHLRRVSGGGGVGLSAPAQRDRVPAAKAEEPGAQRRSAKQIAWKAQHRLHKRYKPLAARGKNKNQIVTALGRELLGFIWAIAVHTEQAAASSPRRPKQND